MDLVAAASDAPFLVKLDVARSVCWHMFLPGSERLPPGLWRWLVDAQKGTCRLRSEGAPGGDLQLPHPVLPLAYPTRPPVRPGLVRLLARRPGLLDQLA
jgi:hypothetical protein